MFSNDKDHIIGICSIIIITIIFVLLFSSDPYPILEIIFLCFFGYLVIEISFYYKLKEKYKVHQELKTFKEQLPDLAKKYEFSLIEKIIKKNEKI